MLDYWQNSADCSFSAAEDVHVWKLPLDLLREKVSRLKDILSEEEKGRAERFHFTTDHNRYVIVRGTLRILLGKYLHINPADIAFIYNQYGKPLLRDWPLQFNVSHSADLGLIAFDPALPLGVDVEWKRPDFASAKIAERFFSAGEVEELQKLPEDQIHQGFFNGWTRKEAYIKALGEGLHIPLSQFRVSLDTDSAELLATGHDPRQMKRWKLYAIAVPQDYAAALMVNISRNKIFLFEIDQQFIDKFL